MQSKEIHWHCTYIRKTVSMWRSSRYVKMFLPSSTQLPQGSGSFSDLVMEVGIYIKLLRHSWSPPQFLAAGSRVLWKCGLGLSLIRKNFFVAFGLNIHWVVWKNRGFMYFKVSESPSQHVVTLLMFLTEHPSAVFGGGKAFQKNTPDLFHIKSWASLLFWYKSLPFFLYCHECNLFMASDYSTLLTLLISNLLIAVIHWFSQTTRSSNLNPVVSPLGYYSKLPNCLGHSFVH